VLAEKIGFAATGMSHLIINPGMRQRFKSARLPMTNVISERLWPLQSTGSSRRSASLVSSA
jgi:hypothetical protein